GLVFSLTQETAFDQPREVIGPLQPAPVLSPAQLELAQWLSRRYLSPLYESTTPFLPPGAEPRTRALFQATESPSPRSLASLSSEEERLYGFIAERGPADLATLKRLFPRLKPEPVLDQLQRKKLVRKRQEIARPRPGPKLAWRLELVGTPEAADVRGSRAKALLALLHEAGGKLDVSEAQRRLGPLHTTLPALEGRGLVRRVAMQLHREPVAAETLPAPETLELTAAQRDAWRSLQAALRDEGGGGVRVFLLHGVTGSGKTELYLLSLAEAIGRGRQGIVLVPEIALTPQTVQQFAARFPGRVAVLHSALSPGEHYEEWMRIKEGRADVVIGSRSAIFAPVPNLGLVVMDEEHEWTYKQELQSPRYQTRDVAVKLAELTGAIVVLGSATPDVATYFRARRGDYTLLTLPERVGETGPLPLPSVEVVDLRAELREDNRSIFSRSLQRAMKEALEKGEQVILFLNRRGSAGLVVCRECGHVMMCRRCDVPLTYHSQEHGLVCHQCNLRRPAPHICPSCWGDKIRFLGIGTESVAEEASALLPGARTIRWDRDVTGSRRSHEAILDHFVKHKADILIGTQMIAKGLHLPLVTLVGVVNADLGLHLPDFRAAERTFQILTQVAGRAGRGPSGGRVIIQTYNPQNYALVAASNHDYQGFYEQEISFRRTHGYPPFTRLARLVYSHTNNQACEKEVFRLLGTLKAEMETKGHRGIHVVGPAPCYFGRVRGRYRWHLILMGKDPRDLLESLALPQGWTLDVDPVSLL
ncbi:MAG TPA: primosomal protein N', partial [Dehalococcoidia bacterium]|nr:primosomal protein N' [Dehalococcoidia bacterium]